MKEIQVGLHPYLELAHDGRVLTVMGDDALARAGAEPNPPVKGGRP